MTHVEDLPFIGERAMKWRGFALLLCLCAPGTSKAQTQQTLLPEAPRPQPGIIVGTVTDVNNDPVPGATVALKPGQYAILTGSKLRIAEALTTVTVAPPIASSEEIAAEQVKVEEQQRIFGFIPNFYVAYNSDAAALTPKLKFKLAAKVSFDPVTIIGVAVFAGIDQAGNTPNYPQGAKGYGERYGAIYADGLTDIMVGGAILPSLLHQDPRYFYKGTGTSKSRGLYALSRPFVCKGDNGQWQPNYSTLGGDLASAAIANAYYPASNRGPGPLLGNFFIDTGQRAFANLAQEFILSKVTRKAKNQN